MQCERHLGLGSEARALHGDGLAGLDGGGIDGHGGGRELLGLDGDRLDGRVLAEALEGVRRVVVFQGHASGLVRSDREGADAFLELGDGEVLDDLSGDGDLVLRVGVREALGVEGDAHARGDLVTGGDGGREAGLAGLGGGGLELFEAGGGDRGRVGADGGQAGGHVVGRALRGDRDDGEDLVGLRGQRDDEVVALDLVVQSGVGAVQLHRGDVVGTGAAQRHRAVGGPLFDAQVDVGVIDHGLAPGLDGEVGRARVAQDAGVSAVPVADALEDGGVPRVVGAVELRADVEEELAAQGHGREHVAHDLGGLGVSAARSFTQGRRVVDLLDVVPVFLGVVRVAGVLEGGSCVIPVRVAPRLVEDRHCRLPGALGLLGLHLVVPADLEVRAIVAHAGVDHDVRLELVGPCTQLVGLLRVRLAHVVPELGDLAVLAAEEFLELLMDVVHVALFVERVGVRPRVLGLLLPVDVGEVEAELDADLLAGLRQLEDRVAVGGRLLGEVVVGRGRVPHGEAVVVLGGDEQHLHAGVLGLLAPRGRVEVGGFEGLGGGQVLVAGDALQRDAGVPGLLVAPRLDLLGVAHFLLLALVPACVGGVDAPVDEHGVLHVLPLGYLRLARGGDGCGDRVARVVGGLGGGGAGLGTVGCWRVCQCGACHS